MTLMLATPSLQWLCHRLGENLRARIVLSHCALFRASD